MASNPAVGTLDLQLALHVSPANERDRAHVGLLAVEGQVATEVSVELAFVDDGYTGADVAKVAAGHGIRIEVVKLHEAKRGSMLLPRR